MNRHICAEELSAYLDGESDAPLRTAQHLAACPECAKRYEDLCELAGALQGVQAPSVSPEFSARVMERVAGTPMERPVWLVPLHWKRWTAVAAAACLVVMVAIYGLPGGQPDFDRGTDQAAVYLPYGLSEEDLVAFLEGNDSQNALTMSSDELITALAEDNWFEAVESSLDDSAHMDSLMSTSEEDAAVLDEVLSEYSREGNML